VRVLGSQELNLHTPVKRNRFVQLSGATRTVNRELEEKTRPHTITAADPIPGDLRQALNAISNASRPAH
jgi:hypothetical protein